MEHEYKYNCDSCKFYTNYNSSWKRHIETEIHKTGKRKIRSDKKRIDKCPKCDYISKNNRSIKQHILTKHSTKKDRQTEFKYYCDKCDYGTFAILLFNKHCSSKKHKQLADN